MSWFPLGSIPKKKFVFRSFGAFLVFFFFWVLIIGFFFVQLMVVEPVDDDFGNRYFTISITVTYENRNSQGNIWYFSKEDKELGLFMNNSWQKVYLLNVSCPIASFDVDLNGNPMAYMEFPTSELEPHGIFTYQVYYRVILKPRVLSQIFVNRSGSFEDVPDDLRTVFCSPIGPWKSDDPVIYNTAYEIVGNETRVLSVLSDFIMWIVQNIKYESLDVPRYPNETLLEKKGDCDDQANLLIGLCRAVGIPAYLQIGCIYKSGTESTSNYWNGLWTSTLTDIGWHGWAVVYVPPWGWLPVDLTYSAGNSSDPLSHITSSAIMTNPTVQYINITVTDYVLDSRLQKALIISEARRILTHDVMIEEVQEKVTSKEIIGTPAQSIIYVGISIYAMCILVAMIFEPLKDILICFKSECLLMIDSFINCQIHGIPGVCVSKWRSSRS